MCLISLVPSPKTTSAAAVRQRGSRSLMLEKLEYMCAVGSIALIGADRLDLLGGHGLFKLTPFLVLAPLVVLIRLLRVALRGRFQVTIYPPIRRQIPFLFVVVLFLFFSLTSTLFGADPQRGLMVLVELVLVFVLGYCISTRILTELAPEKLIVCSVTFALIVYFIFCIGECIAWSRGIIGSGQPGSSFIESTFAPTATLSLVPRLSGFSFDANRASFVLVMYLVLLDRFVGKTRFAFFLRSTIAFFVLLAFSRSAALCWIAYYLFSSAFWKRLTRRAVFSGAILALVCSLVGLVYQKEIAGLFELWQVSDAVSERLSGEQGTSGGDHIQLIERGLETWSTSAHSVVAGIGLAAAPKVLGDFFGDSKYGNFHCLYVTVLAELGLPAFLLLLILLGYPVIARKGALPGIAAIATFNMPYQSHMEPMFWVVLALLWSFELKGRRSQQTSLASVAIA
jgi:hypothetical protein